MDENDTIARNILSIGECMARREIQQQHSNIGCDASNNCWTLKYQRSDQKCYDHNFLGQPSCDDRKTCQAMHVIFYGSLQDGDCALSRGKDSKDHRDDLSFAPDELSFFHSWKISSHLFRSGSLRLTYHRKGRIIDELRNRFPDSQMAYHRSLCTILPHLKAAAMISSLPLPSRWLR